MIKHFLVLVLFCLATPAVATETIVESEDDAMIETDPVAQADDAVIPSGRPGMPFDLIGVQVEPGTRMDLRWSSPQSPGGFAVPVPAAIFDGRARCWSSVENAGPGCGCPRPPGDV